MLHNGGYYAVQFQNGYVPIKLFAITDSEKQIIFHITIFSGLYERITDIPLPDEHAFLIEHVAVTADTLDHEILELLREMPIYPEEENMYRIWRDEWNNGQAIYYSVPFRDLLPLLCKGEK